MPPCGRGANASSANAGAPAVTAAAAMVRSAWALSALNQSPLFIRMPSLGVLGGTLSQPIQKTFRETFRDAMCRKRALSTDLISVCARRTGKDEIARRIAQRAIAPTDRHPRRRTACRGRDLYRVEGVLR